MSDYCSACGNAIAAVAAAILILIVVGDGILNREWLSGSSTDDEQQYAIQGKILDPGLVGEGAATDDDTTADSLTTTDWEDVVDFLGMEPILPGYLPINTMQSDLTMN